MALNLRSDYSNLTILHFECFIWVAKCGTMLKAAEQLSMSQPLLSQKIKQLENQTGIELFTRHKKRLLLTEAGSEFLEKCSGILHDLDQTIRIINEKYVEDADNIVTIGFTDGIETSEINAIVSSLQEEFHESIFETKIDSRLVITDMLLSGEIDICYMVDTERLSTNRAISYRKLDTLPLNGLFHASSPIAQLDQVDIQELDNYRFFWPTSFKNTYHTKDLQRLFKSYAVHIIWDYCDIDYYTLRRYLFIERSFTITLSQTVDDPTMKIYPLGGLSYPLIIAWKKTNTKRFEQYTDNVLQLRKRRYNR